MEAMFHDPAREERLAHQRHLARAKAKRQSENPLAYSPGLAILTAMGRYHHLTLKQVLRLTGWRSETYASAWLKRLSRCGYLYDKNFIAEGPYRPYGVWSLTAKGRYALHQRGYPAEIHIPSSLKRDSDWLRHVRDLNDTLMQFERLAHVRSDYELTGFAHDLELQRRAVKLTLPDGTNRNFVPDGWVELSKPDLAFDGGAALFCFCVEMDRGTEREGGKPWKEKIRCYTEFAKGAYQEMFERDQISVLVVARSHVQTDQRRLENLLRWTEEELTALKGERAPRWGKMFLFTIQHADETDPRIFFGSPSWYHPFERKPLALLEEAL